MSEVQLSLFREKTSNLCRLASTWTPLSSLSFSRLSLKLPNKGTTLFEVRPADPIDFVANYLMKKKEIGKAAPE